MKKIELTDRELTNYDFSTFELLLQANGGILLADEETVDDACPRHIRLIHPAVEFDEVQSRKCEIEHLLARYGFHRR